MTLFIFYLIYIYESLSQENSIFYTSSGESFLNELKKGIYPVIMKNFSKKKIDILECITMENNMDSKNIHDFANGKKIRTVNEKNKLVYNYQEERRKYYENIIMREKNINSILFSNNKSTIEKDGIHLQL